MISRNCASFTSFIAGPLVDKFTAKRIFPLHVLPLVLGLILIMIGDNKYFALVYLCLAGVSTSLMSISSTPMWTEIFGARQLGSVKSMSSTMVVMASALGPLILGTYLENVSLWKYSVTGMVSLMVIIAFCTFYLLNGEYTANRIKRYRAYFKAS